MGIKIQRGCFLISGVFCANLLYKTCWSWWVNNLADNIATITHFSYSCEFCRVSDSCKLAVVDGSRVHSAALAHERTSLRTHTYSFSSTSISNVVGWGNFVSSLGIFTRHIFGSNILNSWVFVGGSHLRVWGLDSLRVFEVLRSMSCRSRQCR